MTAFRPTATKATIIAAIGGPVAAWLLSSMWGSAGGLPLPDFAAATIFVLIVSIPITLVGLVLVGLPLTLLGERLGRGSALPVAIFNGCLSVVGFALAYDAEWPMIEVQQIFWLTLACTALVFTAVYLGFDRKLDETTLA